MAAKRKSFINPPEGRNPALSYISDESIAAVEGQQHQPEEPQATAPDRETLEANKPEGYKLNPYYVEVKSKRVQIVLRPSVYEGIKAASKADGTSFNDYVHRLLEEDLKRREHR